MTDVEREIITGWVRQALRRHDGEVLRDQTVAVNDLSKHEQIVTVGGRHFRVRISETWKGN